MDLERLGNIVRSLVSHEVSRGTHADITANCQKLGLPAPDAGTKRERTAEVVDGIQDDQIERLANQLLTAFPLRAADRNALEDAMWTDAGYPELPKRTRREIAESLDHSDLYIDARHFDILLNDLWVLSEDPMEAVSAAMFGLQDQSLRAEINRHVFRNPDWSGVELFDNLGAYEASDHRFALFLEGLASSDVRPNEDEQRRFVEVVNGPLQKQGLELRETGSEGGYPTFEVVSIHATPRGRPKNLIFASSMKPDLRFRDAIDNEVEIVTGADKVLVYDRPIGHDGLRWSDLQAWWKDAQRLDDDNRAKNSLYRRLRSSLPESSPPQLALFDGFYNGF